MIINEDKVEWLLIDTWGIGGNGHIDDFIAQPGYDYGVWVNDKSIMLPVISGALRSAWQSWNYAEREQVKGFLQYGLNHDQNLPDTEWKFVKGTTYRPGGFTIRLFTTFQHLVVPINKYHAYLWMWEALFPNEDWHLDIDGWVVVNKKGQAVDIKGKVKNQSKSIIQKVFQRFIK